MRNKFMSLRSHSTRDIWLEPPELKQQRLLSAYYFQGPGSISVCSILVFPHHKSVSYYPHGMDDKIKLRKLKQFAPNDSGVNGVSFSKSEIKPLPMPITLKTLEPLMKMAEPKISECTGEELSLGKLG